MFIFDVNLLWNKQTNKQTKQTKQNKTKTTNQTEYEREKMIENFSLGVKPKNKSSLP